MKKYIINTYEHKMRKDIYEKIDYWTDNGFVFADNNHYLWFKENIAKENLTHIMVSYSTTQIYRENSDFVQINIAFIDKFWDQIFIKQIDLTKGCKNFPKFETRKDN